MRSATRTAAIVVLALTLWIGSACGASTSRSATSPTPSSTSPIESTPTSPAGVPNGTLGAVVPMPIGFPSDFPIYPGARLTVAGKFTPDGATTWGLEWQTLDGPGKVQTLFIAKLKTGDWTLLTHTGTASTSFSATFRRKSIATVAGTLGIVASAGVTKITLVLTTVL